MSVHWEYKGHVNVNGNWIPVDQVEFIDIEEDIRGYDLMTFRYNGVEYSSKIVNLPIDN